MEGPERPPVRRCCPDSFRLDLEPRLTLPKHARISSMYWGECAPDIRNLIRDSDSDELTLRLAPRLAGGTVTPSGSLVPTAFPPFMDSAWPNVLDRIAETGVYDEWTGGKGSGKMRGPNHVSPGRARSKSDHRLLIPAICSDSAL